MSSVPQPLCPDCGTALSEEPVVAGLCPSCLIGLGFSESLVAELEEGETFVLESSGDLFSPGHVLGGRYRVHRLLGSGGMGEVWRAYDLKLRVDVALKALHARFLDNDRALETLRQEVRGARSVLSPNVCRVFDLVELDGRELVSMEYVDGTTLRDVLEERSPLDLGEARALAAQFLAGLEAIHEAGLVHRDVKPENLMLTRAGRMVVMDFGIAKVVAERGGGTVAGTPAYMAPEQARGGAVDARADVFAAGVVLAEMVDPGGVRSNEQREVLWRAIHSQKPVVEDSPWADVVRRSVARRRDRRPPSAAALARALEEIAIREGADEDLRPYPGLASFTAEDAGFFFGRELEVEALWKKLERTQLLALVGPSGVGKSSFLRAGLLATLPPDWRALITAPGRRPFAALAQALAGDFAGDTDAVRRLLRFDDPDMAVTIVSDWRQGHRHALVVLDQFEELFTQNPPEVQAEFTALLSRLVLEADVHVLLSLRDDFLLHCAEHDGLAPVFGELTPLRPLAGASLRRAVVQPALEAGYSFEDEALVDEILRQVEEERGALPLLAFAAARLWELRDRENGRLTRAAYEQIGGVAGALAQHAEATLERIGQDRLHLVRELLRNLVTAQGTRAARDRDELLSVFPDEGERSRASEVLEELVDARLLTSYETPGENGSERLRRLEIIHESLLSNWPRLVRWRTQDADSAQLRDQLRQAAQIWDDRGRPEDLLWVGTVFKEFEVWQERYEGGLTETEQRFATAMGARARRRRRRRQTAVAAVVALALGVAAVTSSLWRRSETALEKAVVAEAQAREEARRAEASKLMTLAQLEEDKDATVALAYAVKSLELFDTGEARTFALKSLAASPPARMLVDADRELAFASSSPDGRWVVFGGDVGLSVQGRDGEPLKRLDTFPAWPGGVSSRFSAAGDRLVAYKGGVVRTWSVPAFEPLARHALPALGGRGFSAWLWRCLTGYYGFTWKPGAAGPETAIVQVSSEGVPGRVRVVPGKVAREGATVDRSGRWLVYFDQDRADEIVVRSLVDWRAAPRRIDRRGEGLLAVALDSDGGRLAELLRDGELRIWPFDPSDPMKEGLRPERTLEGRPRSAVSLALGGNRVVVTSAEGGVGVVTELWDLSAPADARPVTILSDYMGYSGVALSADGDWVITTHIGLARFFPVVSGRPLVFAIERPVLDLLFASNEALLSVGEDGGVTRWDLAAGGRKGPLLEDDRVFRTLALHRESGLLGMATSGLVVLSSLQATPPTELRGFSRGVRALAFDVDGRRVAATSAQGPRADKVIRIWDLDGDELVVLGPTEEAAQDDDAAGAQFALAFLPGDRLLSSGDGGLRAWDLASGTSEVVVPAPMIRQMSLLPGRGKVAYLIRDEDGRRLALTDLERRQTTILSAHGVRVESLAVDPGGRFVVTGSTDGKVRVGPISGEEPHLLLGHQGGVTAVAISPDGTRIVTASAGTIRIWPVPELAATPFHTLPHAELLARLHGLTNLRVVETPESSTGWGLDLDPFPGWKDVPAW